jgi:tetratricopeptide (TPR) repeat protein
MARIAAQLKRWDRLAAIYADSLEEATSDDDVTAELSFQSAQLFDARVGDTTRARKYYRRALAFDPGRAEVFSALESLLQRESAHDELLSLYRDAAERANDVEERKGYLFMTGDETGYPAVPAETVKITLGYDVDADMMH